MAGYARAILLAPAALLAVLAAAPATASAAVEIGAERIVVRGDGASATIVRRPFRMTFADASGRTVLSHVDNRSPAPLVEPPTVDPEPNGSDSVAETTLYSPLTFTVGRESIQQFPAATWVANLETANRSGVQYAARDVVDAAAEGDGVRLTLSTSDPTRRLVVRVTPNGPRAIRVSARVTPDDGVAIVGDSFATGTDEAFRGFGGRHNAIDQRGTKLESFLNQSNISPGGLAPAVGLAPGTGGDRYMFPNGPTGAYFVQSQFVSSRDYGFLSLRDELTRWRMASDRPDAWQVAASSAGLDYVVTPGSAPQAIERLTEITGRQRVPPAWALEPQMDRLVRFPPQAPAAYRAEVLQDLADIERFDLPLGSYRIEAWEFFDRATLRDVIARFRRRDIRVLLYFRAFVGRDDIGTDAPERYDEALAKGYVATDASGGPFKFVSNFAADSAQIDFTDPEAVAWWKGRIKEALDLGADGFMQDFGEQVFFDMRFHNGETGATMHNKLPVLFHRATREALDEYRRAHPERGEAFFYTRSGYSGTPGSVVYESATWPGDETTDFSRSSGLASQAPDMLNRGIAGAVGFGTDIGGYFDAGRDPTTRELFERWAEWAALTPIFRLHGSVGAGTHTPWSYGPETLERYKRMSRLHQAAAPLIRRLWEESTRTGMPIARPLWLAVPGDARAAEQDQEWLLGPDVLVAPVVTQGATGRDVYFPAGCWRHPETGARFEGARSARVEAPLGTLPYFFRCDKRPFEPPAPPAKTAAKGPVACASSAGFASVSARPRRRGVDVRFARRVRRPVTVDVFQVSAGRRVLGERRVARFSRRTATVRWSGRPTSGRALSDGLFVVRVAVTGPSGRPDVRRLALERRNGRFRRRGDFYRRASCGTLTAFKLERPAFGGTEARPLRIAFRLARAGSVRVEVLRGSRVVRRFGATQRSAQRTHRLRVGARSLPRGEYRVRLVARPKRGATVVTTLSARRL